MYRKIAYLSLLLVFVVSINSTEIYADEYDPFIIDVFQGESIRLVEWNPQEDLLAVLLRSDPIEIQIVNPVTGEIEKELQLETENLSQPSTLAWSPDGTMLVSFEVNETLRLWDLETGTNFLSLNVEEVTGIAGGSFLSSVDWSPDGQQIVVGDTDNFGVWDIETNDFRWTDPTGVYFAAGVAWSPNGQQIAAIDEGSAIAILDADSFEAIHIIPLHEFIRSSGPTTALQQSQYLQWSPDGARIVNYFSNDPDFYIFVWDVVSGELIETIENRDGYLQAIAWSPDGRTLASASGEWFENGGKVNLVRIWDMETYTLLYVLEGHSELVTTVAWSPDGTQLASGSEDGTIMIWDMPQ